MYVALMRRFAWASPRAIKRLTPRQVYVLFTTALPGDEQGGPAPPVEQPPEDAPTPEMGTREEYDAMRAVVLSLGFTKEQADAEWLAKRGPIPPPEG